MKIHYVCKEKNEQKKIWMSHINLFAKSSISFIQVFDFSDRNLISEILVRFEKMIRIYQIDCYFLKKKTLYHFNTSPSFFKPFIPFQYLLKYVLQDYRSYENAWNGFALFDLPYFLNSIIQNLFLKKVSHFWFGCSSYRPVCWFCAI